jgi:hypothetical protein
MVTMYVSPQLGLHHIIRLSSRFVPAFNRLTIFSIDRAPIPRVCSFLISASKRAWQIQNTHRNCRQLSPKSVRRGVRGTAARHAGRNAHSSDRRANPRGISCKFRHDRDFLKVSTARRNCDNVASFGFAIYDLQFTIAREKAIP